MKRITVLCLIIFITMSLSNVIGYASDLNIKLNGGFDFQTGLYQHNLGRKLAHISKHNKDVAFNSSGHMTFEMENILRDNFSYGAKIGIEIAAKNDRKMPSAMYITSNYGKLEFGSDKSATNKMKITAYSIGAGTVGGWDGWATQLTRDANRIAYVTNFGNFLDAKTRDGDKVEYARKISYFSPKSNHGVQFGISYIPDSVNQGHGTINSGSYHNLSKPLQRQFAIKNGIGYGITFERNIANDIKIKTAFVGEKAVVRSKIPVTSQDFTNLNTYTIGSQMDFSKKYSLAVSYGNYMQSITSATMDTIGRDTYLYGVGGRYNYCKFGTSIHYFFSKHKANKFDAITLAHEYKIATGILTYMETTYYNTRGKFFNKENIIVADKSRGALLLLGLKVEF